MISDNVNSIENTRGPRATLLTEVTISNRLKGHIAQLRNISYDKQARTSYFYTRMAINSIEPNCFVPSFVKISSMVFDKNFMGYRNVIAIIFPNKKNPLIQ